MESEFLRPRLEFKPGSTLCVSRCIGFLYLQNGNYLVCHLASQGWLTHKSMEDGNFSAVTGKTLYIAVVQSLSCVQLFATPWTAAHQASLFFIISQSLLKLMSIKWVMPSNHLIPRHPLLLPPSVFPSIRDFSSESALCIRWPKHSASASVFLMNIQD